MTHQLLFYREPRQIERFQAYIDEIAQAGVTHLTLAPKMGDIDLRTPNGASRSRKILSCSNILAHGMHAPFGANCDLNIIGAHKTHTRLISTVAELGVRTYVLHAGLADHATPLAGQWDTVRRNLDRLLPLAENDDLILAIENLPPAYLGNNAQDLIALVLVYDSPHLRLCFDSGHAHMNESVCEILRHMAPHVATMHLHDNDGTRDAHLSPGYGTIPWPNLAAVITDECRPIHVEIEAFNHEKLTVPQILALYNDLLG